MTLIVKETKVSDYDISLNRKNRYSIIIYESGLMFLHGPFKGNISLNPRGKITMDELIEMFGAKKVKKVFNKAMADLI